MVTVERKQWVRVAILIGVAYFAVNFGVGAAANSADLHFVRVWRLAAFVASVALYAWHILYERLRLGRSPITLALHAAAAVALGALLLATAAIIHSFSVASRTPHWQYLLTVVVWPLAAAGPALVFALVAGALIPRQSLRYCSSSCMDGSTKG